MKMAMNVCNGITSTVCVNTCTRTEVPIARVLINISFSKCNGIILYRLSSYWYTSASVTSIRSNVLLQRGSCFRGIAKRSKFSKVFQQMHQR